jgi:hypothetical protein
MLHLKLYIQNLDQIQPSWPSEFDTRSLISSFTMEFQCSTITIISPFTNTPSIHPHAIA